MNCLLIFCLLRDLYVTPSFLLPPGNNILIVAHASSLEACTRQLQGLTPQNSKDFVQVVRKVNKNISESELSVLPVVSTFQQLRTD